MRPQAALPLRKGQGAVDTAGAGDTRGTERRIQLDTRLQRGQVPPGTAARVQASLRTHMLAAARTPEQRRSVPAAGAAGAPSVSVLPGRGPAGRCSRSATIA